MERPPLYGRRQRIAERDEQIVSGTAIYTSFLDSDGRSRLFATVNGSSQHGGVAHIAEALIAQDLGAIVNWEVSLRTTTDPEMLASLLEAYYWSLPNDLSNRSKFQADVNTVLSEHMVSFEMIDGKMIPFESREMHVEIVQPTLQLLGRDGWSAVETAYQEALREVRGSPDDAITDAARALELTLDTLGCDGNTLGKKTEDAIRKGLLENVDKKLYDWIAAERANRGDAHGVSDATHSEAWRIVHIVGAEILRLVERSGQ